MNKIPIVLTMYGTGEVINNVTVTLFNTDGYSLTSVEDHCNNINEIELNDDNWIYAFIVKENKKIKLAKPIRCDLEILASLDDHAIQRVIRETGFFVLPKALISVDKNILSAVLRNMSKRAAKMLIEDIKYQLNIPKKDIQEAQKKVVDLIQNMERTGEIIIPKFYRNKTGGGALTNNELNTILSGDY